MYIGHHHLCAGYMLMDPNVRGAVQRGGPGEVQLFPLRLVTIIVHGKPLLRAVANDMLYSGSVNPTS